MNPGDSNQQWQQQQQQQQHQQLQAPQHHQQQEREQQQPKRIMDELVQELVQKEQKLNRLMVTLARKRTANAQLRIRYLATEKKLMEVAEAKNEIAKTCNSMSEWVQETQKKLEKSKNAIQSGKQYIKTLNEIDDEKFRALTLELESLPTEDELQQYAKKKREQQQELDDLHKIIEDLEVKLANEDDEETLAAKLREVQQSNAELEAELKKSAEQPANPDAIKIKAEMDKKAFLDNYFNVASLKDGTSSADVTSTKVDTDGNRTGDTQDDYGFSDDSMSS